METAKIFKTGRSQAVRIPKKYRLAGTEVKIRKEGDNLILTPLPKRVTMEEFLAMPKFPDFELDREPVQKIQKRELFG